MITTLFCPACQQDTEHGITDGKFKICYPCLGREGAKHKLNVQKELSAEEKQKIFTELKT